eukprot:gene16759-19107_t
MTISSPAAAAANGQIVCSSSSSSGRYTVGVSPFLSFSVVFCRFLSPRPIFVGPFEANAPWTLRPLPFTYPDLEKLVQANKEQRMLPHFTIFKDVSDPCFIGLLSPLTPRVTRSALCVTDMEYRSCIVPEVILDHNFETNGTWSEYCIAQYYEESQQLMNRFADRIGGFAEGLQNSLRTLYLQDDLQAPLSLGGARPVKKLLQQVAHPYQNMRILDKVFRDAACPSSTATATATATSSTSSVCALQTLSLFVLLEPSIIPQRLADDRQVQELQKRHAAAAAAYTTAASPTSHTDPA